MSSTVIADSSCLIGLARIDRLTLLKDLFTEILVPDAVYREVVDQGAGRPGADAVRAAPWIRCQHVKDQLAVRTLRVNRLGLGECEAIVLALECGANFLILDDAKARRAALALDLPVVGTVAVLHKAAEKGLLRDLDGALARLRQAGFHFVQ
jgi:uncharacterized protein